VLELGSGLAADLRRHTMQDELFITAVNIIRNHTAMAELFLYILLWNVEQKGHSEA